MAELAAGWGRMGYADSDHPACGRKDPSRISMGRQREGAVLAKQEEPDNR